MAEVEPKEREESNTLTDYDDHLLLDTLPKEKDWYINGAGICLYKGFWYNQRLFTKMLSLSHHYKAEPSDILLVTAPKCGTTWLKALAFSITTRHHISLSDSPLLRSNPHAVVRSSFETDLISDDLISLLENLPRPRLIPTHIPYHALPPSVITSGCKIVSILRDPRDQFVSNWHFLDKLLPELTIRPLEECFDLFCRGVHGFGPFWDHFLSVFNASKDRPDKILILRYEEMKVSPVDQTRKLACFLGFPFSEEEEKEGVVEEIVKLCSFDNLKGLRVNKEGRRDIGILHKAYFRKGEVGDWSNYITPSMNNRIQELMKEKFGSSGLTFD